MNLAGRFGQLVCVWVAALAVVGMWALGTRPDATAARGVDATAPSQAPSSTQKMLAGIPQDGTSLGDPDAPVVITEYVDLQCPFCREFALGVLPRLLDEHVRTGRVRLELRVLRFLGADSERLAATAASAAASDRMWNVVELMFERQGAENSGYATDEYLQDILRDAGVTSPAADGEKVLADAEEDARRAGIEGTPSFLVTEGGRTVPLQLSEITYEAFDEALAEATR